MGILKVTITRTLGPFPLCLPFSTWGLSAHRQGEKKPEREGKSCSGEFLV